MTSAAVPMAPLDGSRFLSALHQITLRLARPAEASRILRTVAGQARALAGARGAFLALRTADPDLLEVRFTSGSLAPAEGELIPLDGLAPGAGTDPDTHWQAIASGVISPVTSAISDRAMVLPLLSGGGLSGLLVVECSELEECRHRLRLMQEFARVASAVVENVESFARARSGADRLALWRESAAAQRWNERYQAITRALGMVVFEWDRAADRILWSDALHSVLGFQEHELGTSMEALVGSFGEGDRSSVREALRTAEWSGGGVDAVVRMRDAAGASRQLRLRMIPADRADDTCLGLLVEEPEHAADPRRVGSVAARIVRVLQHEINNPLAAIMGQAQLLLSSAHPEPMQEDLRQGLTTMYEESRRIAGIVERISGAPEQLAEIVPGAPLPAASGPGEATHEGFRSIVERLREGVLIIDPERIIRYANSGMNALLGFSPARLIGLRLEDVLRQTEEVEQIAAHVESTLAGISAPLTLCVQGSAGEELWLRLVGSSFPAPDGQTPGALYTLTDVTLDKRAEERIREQALQDELTGLPNRTVLIERLEHAIARAKRHEQHQFAILFMDCDHLKQVNDSFGHAAGDALLVQVTRRLRNCIRPEDTLARIGGDEFCLLLEGITDTADATRVARRILQEIREPMKVLDYEVTASISIGIVLSGPEYETPAQLLADADLAMYRAKKIGRGRFEIFDRQMHKLVTSRLRDESELRRALDQGEFRLHYQPIISLTTRRIVGMEALLRWQHPQRGIILPDDFIPLAEEANLMLPIGQWVLETAARALRHWKDSYAAAAPQWIAVNLSCKQFLQPGLAGEIQKVLTDASLEPSELRVEIKEAMVSQNSGAAAENLRALAEMGVRVNMDDFGTGLSSIGGLSKLDIESLKIDPSFVQAIRAGDAATRLVKTLLTVATGVGASAIAEGVTTIEQIGALQEMGCQYAQGYFFSHPLSENAIEGFLLSGHASGSTF